MHALLESIKLPCPLLFYTHFLKLVSSILVSPSSTLNILIGNLFSVEITGIFLVCFYSNKLKMIGTKKSITICNLITAMI